MLGESIQKQRQCHNAIDLIGHRFGRLTVISRSVYTKPNGKKEAIWECQCDCGGVVRPTTGNLNSGNTKSCGCTRKEKLTKLAIDMRGKRCGRLLVLSLHERKVLPNGKLSNVWECRCDCGKTSHVSTMWNQVVWLS